MNADIVDDNLVQAFVEQDEYVQILGVDTEGVNEEVDIPSLDIDGCESVFIDIDSDYGNDDPDAFIQEVISE